MGTQNSLYLYFISNKCLFKPKRLCLVKRLCTFSVRVIFFLNLGVHTTLPYSKIVLNVHRNHEDYLGQGEDGKGVWRWEIGRLCTIVIQSPAE